MHWPRDLTDWPHRALSQRFPGPIHRWHVQTSEPTGKPDLLLIHGAGGSTHSWRHQIEPLSRHWRVLVPDLPGHGFSTLGTRNRSGLPEMAHDLRTLGLAQGWDPVAIVGHSAGVAIALELTAQGAWANRPVIGINAALGSFPGLAGVVFPILAQVMAAAPFVPRLVAKQVGQEHQIARLIESTGSQLDDAGRALYRRLAADPDHIAGTLRMMAQWDLEPLRARFATHGSHVTLLAGEEDKTVPPITSVEAAGLLAHGSAQVIPNLGHLAHEEAPELIESWLTNALSPKFGAQNG